MTVADAISPLLKHIGLNGTSVVAACGADPNYCGDLLNIRNRIGEMPHFPNPSTGKQVVAFQVQNFAGEVDPPNEFLERPDATQKASEGKLTYINFSKTLGEVKKKGQSDVQDDNSDEDEDSDEESEQPSAENSCVLWLSSEYESVRKRMKKHCHDGAGETEEIKKRLCKGNTDTGNLKIGIFEAEFEAIKQLKGKMSLASKVCALLSLTQTMADDTYWMHDKEDPEAVESLMNDVSGYWRNTLLCHKNNDSALGLGATDCAEERASSRVALTRLLKFYQKQFESSGDGAKFNCTPGPQRKRRSSVGNEGSLPMKKHCTSV